MSTTEQRGSRIGGSAFALGAALLLASCAAVQPDARMPAVQSLVTERTGQSVTWSQGGEAEVPAREAVRALLKQPLSADAAVQIALLYNQRMQASLRNLGIAQADLVEAGLLANPVFSASALFQDAGTEIEVNVVQDFVSVFALSARRKIGETGAERVTFEVAQSALDLAAEVRAQYYRVVGDAQSLALSRQVVRATEAAAELAQRQYAAGNLSKRDQSLQQAFYAQTLLEVALAQSQFDADREKLNRLLGLWGADTAWKIPDRLPAVPAALPSLANVEKLAVSRRLDLAAARKEVDGIAQTLDLSRQLRWLSPLGIGVKFKHDADGERSYGPEIELGLPLFDRGQARIARLEAQRQRAEAQMTALATDIRSEARTAAAHVNVLHQSVRHFEQALLPLQQTVVTETLKFYNGMLVGVYDLLLASQGQIQTGRQYVATSRDFWLAWTELEHVAGGVLQAPAANQPPPALNSNAPSLEGDEHQHGDR
jgi:outer membrane protein, heavy metal efflux system